MAKCKSNVDGRYFDQVVQCNQRLVLLLLLFLNASDKMLFHVVYAVLI